MKKLLCILLMLLFALPVLAEENPFAPYLFPAPEGVTLEENEGTYTFVAEETRAVAIRIARVPDEYPEEAVIRMMTQFEPDAIIGESLPAAQGFEILTALNEDKFGDGVDQITVMVLSHEGDLLILSAHDLSGDMEKTQALLDELLAGLTFQDAPVLLPPEE